MTKFLVKPGGSGRLPSSVCEEQSLNLVMYITSQCYRGKWKKTRDGAVLLEGPCSEGINAWFLLVPLHHAIERQIWFGGREEEISI